jgi:hypothetical protein
MEFPKPVILKLEGGLGNQLFQFAAGYFLAAKLDCELFVDQYSIPLSTVHGEKSYGFDSFAGVALPNSKSIIFMEHLPNKYLVAVAKKFKTIKKALLKFRLHYSNAQKLELFVESNELSSTKDFFDLDAPVKLHGNFQSWGIVEKAAQYGFPRRIQLLVKPEWILRLEKEIDFSTSLVVHFRVGEDAKSNLLFKQPSVEYYRAALKHFRKKGIVGKIFVLSDDIKKAKELYGSLVDEDMSYLEMPLTSTPAERVFLMSLFTGIICANSTFCGWAAWSIHNSGGDVVVPVPYSDGEVLGSRDFPQTWIQLDKYSGRLIG